MAVVQANPTSIEVVEASVEVMEAPLRLHESHGSFHKRPWK